jgi:hypothetical protein
MRSHLVVEILASRNLRLARFAVICARGRSSAHPLRSSFKITINHISLLPSDLTSESLQIVLNK